MSLRRALELRDIEVTRHSWNTLNFCMPIDYVLNQGINIGYTPWESTELPESWLEPLAKLDDFWTTASWLKPIFEPYVKDVFVLEHGIDQDWTPIYRSEKIQDRFNFLHVGEPALRKGGEILLRVWSDYFADHPKMHLTIKCMGNSDTRYKNKSFYDFDNVTVIGHTLSVDQMWKLYALSNCMVYPSRGEGFGLIPLQAMATGMPTILPDKCMGDYADSFGIRLRNSKLVESEYQEIHPGLWLEHDEEEIAQKMLDVYLNYESATIRAILQAQQIHKDYAWDRIADQAIERLSLIGLL